MNCYYCPKCSKETTGPEWKLNYLSTPITINVNDRFPLCPRCNLRMQPTTGIETEEEIEES
jgi:hypothetical protein